uniref:Uncharacterized protein AlNc14C106G6217 n=1 Tax=Albugo laibachii Nc14 TaxID=890382 RepID=F0WI10_9STRA|nr:conserved hypothetical protein [Albugo laibachii Nc14]|eukprot:CCA20887.1 conserved hypothetical protein [Albugo laibachii Nc14]
MSFRMQFATKPKKKPSKSEKQFGLFKPFDATKPNGTNNTTSPQSTGNLSPRSLKNRKFTIPVTKSTATHHKRLQEEALAQDPSIFDYDGVYDTIHAPKASSSFQKLSSTQKKPKYINAIMEKAKIREMEHERIRERRLQRERQEEDEEYGGKEKLISASYKRILMERKEWELEDKRLEQQEKAQDVRLRGEEGMAAFYANLTTKNIALGGDVQAATSAYTVKEVDGTTDSTGVKRKLEVKMESETHSPVVDKPVSAEFREEEKPSKEDVIAAAKARFLARKSERRTNTNSL